MNRSVRVTYRTDHNKNKDMSEFDSSDFDLIDLDTLDLSDEQIWSYKVSGDTGQRLDITGWVLSVEAYEDERCEKALKKILTNLDEFESSRSVVAMPERHKFDSRTFVRPKKAYQRPTIQSIMEAASNPSSLPGALNSNKYLTYNKYNTPPQSLTAPVDENDSLLDDADVTLVSNSSRRQSSNTPIKIDLSQPVHNIPSTFNKGVMLGGMEQSAESLMRMSPPSLVWSSHIETSGHYANANAADPRKSINSMPPKGRESCDPMATSMSLSVLDEKDMNTSFLSQTTHPDHDSLMDSLPPSLVSSLSSSHEPRTEANVFTSATYTRLEQEKLLPGRPRHHVYSWKRDHPMRSSGSYIKSKEEACQIDKGKGFNESADKTEAKPANEMSETITLHFANNKFRKNNNSAEKENLNTSFEKDDTFYKDMNMEKTPVESRISNVTLDKQELNEIIQARQKLSLARKALPSEPERTLPNQIEASNSYVIPKKTIQNSSELLSRKKLGGNSYEISDEPVREPPKRTATFKKPSPPRHSMDTTVVVANHKDNEMNSTFAHSDSTKIDATFNLIQLATPVRPARTKKPAPPCADDTVIHVKDDKNIIDINSATINLTDTNGKHEEWGGSTTMAWSGSSTDTATFSSSSPPDAAHPDPSVQVASTPLLKKYGGRDLLDLPHISPIYGADADERPPDGLNALINTTTIRKSPKKSAAATSPEKRFSAPPTELPAAASYGTMPPPKAPVTVAKMPAKSGLPASKLRQYSSHRELRLPSSNNGVYVSAGVGAGAGAGLAGRAVAARRGLLRRGVYGSNPALSPTAPAPPAHLAYPAHPAHPAALQRTDSYTIASDAQIEKDVPRPVLKNPPALIRQGTETLRRDRPLSQMVPPKDFRAMSPACGPPAPARSQLRPVTIVRPSSGAGAGVGAGASHPRGARPSVGPKPSSAPPAQEPRAPRPSRLPAPRRTLRPPSVYSVAPAADADQY